MIDCIFSVYKQMPGAMLMKQDLGVLAQLGEHLLCTQGVRSSILLRSTIV